MDRNVLPDGRGPFSQAVRRSLVEGTAPPPPASVALDDVDVQCGLWLLERLDTTGFTGVDPDAEHRLDLIGLRTALEDGLLAALRRECRSVDRPLGAHLRAVLRRATPSPDDAGPEAVLQTFAAKAPYLTAEADPHTMAMARLEPDVQHVVAEIQAGEYGVGHRSTHSQVYVDCLAAAGLDVAAAHRSAVAASYAFANAAWLFARRRSLRGAALGQLALIEVDSVEPCKRRAAAWDRVGLPAAGRRWYDLHVVADAEHERLVFDRLVPLVEQIPALSATAALGVESTWVLQNRCVGQLRSTAPSARAA